MKPRLLAVIVVFCVSSSANAQPPQQITAGAEDWVVAADIPPFVVIEAHGRHDASGMTEAFFELPSGNGGGSARYSDGVRHMFVEVAISRERRVDYVEYLTESLVRSPSTGRFPEPETALLFVNGNAVLQVCIRVPDCDKRSYYWRSHLDIIRIRTTALSDDAEGRQVQLECPEPTEILHAYVQRYPSTLTQEWDEPTLEWANSEERVRSHLRMQAAIELAAAKYWAEVSKRKPADAVSQSDLRKIKYHAERFGELCEKNLAGPPSQPKQLRAAMQNAKESEKLDALNGITDEYVKWWTQNIGTTLSVPELPASTPPTIAPSPVPTS